MFEQPPSVGLVLSTATSEPVLSSPDQAGKYVAEVNVYAGLVPLSGLGVPLPSHVVQSVEHQKFPVLKSIAIQSVLPCAKLPEHTWGLCTTPSW